MSKHNDNWINKVREELNNYSPEYNASDWDALKGNLPKPHKTVFWSKSKLNLWKGIVLISGIVVVTLVLWKTLEKPTEVISESSVEQIMSNTTVSNNSANVNNNTPDVITPQTSPDTPTKQSAQNSQAGPKRIQPEPKNNSVVGANTELQHKKIVQESASTKTFKESITAKQAPKKNPSAKKTDNIRTTKSLSTQSTEKQLVTKQEEREELNTSQTQKISLEQEDVINDQEAKGIELRGKKLKTNKKKRKPNRRRNFNIGKTKTNNPKAKAIKIKHPVYYGLNASVNYFNTTPYGATVKLSGGLTFEKFISPRSSIEIAPKLNGGKFKFSENKTIYDTTIVTEQVIVDSIPVIQEHLNISENISTIPHSTNLFYIDIPVFYNLYLTNGKKSSLGMGLGLSNKYLVNYKQDSEKISLSQNLYLAQAGIIQFNYRRELNSNLHFRVSPFAEIPLRNSPETITNKTFYGIRFDLLFKTK